MDAPGAPEPASAPAPPDLCVACRRPIKAGAAFCTSCGHRKGDARPLKPAEDTLLERMRRTEREWREIRFVMLFYLLLLGVQVVVAVAIHLKEDEFLALALGDALLALATVIATALHLGTVRGLYSRIGFGPLGYGAIALLSLPIFFGVYFFVAGVEGLFDIRQEELPQSLRAGGLGWVLLMFVFTPAVFEELAFRGVIFGILVRRVRLSEAFILSSVAFAILHLSVLSLATHVPMGLYFCWLRHRSGSLYPPMAAHALHNGLVVANEYLKFMPWS